MIVESGKATIRIDGGKVFYAEKTLRFNEGNRKLISKIASVGGELVKTFDKYVTHYVTAGEDPPMPDDILDAIMAGTLKQVSVAKLLKMEDTWHRVQYPLLKTTGGILRLGPSNSAGKQMTESAFLAPTNYVQRMTESCKQPSDSTAIESTIKFNYIHGYNGADTRLSDRHTDYVENMKVGVYTRPATKSESQVRTDTYLIWFIAKTMVVLDTQKSKVLQSRKQKYFKLHDADITCMALNNQDGPGDRRIVASGQGVPGAAQGRRALAKLFFWDYPSCKLVKMIDRVAGKPLLSPGETIRRVLFSRMLNDTVYYTDTDISTPFVNVINISRDNSAAAVNTRGGRYDVLQDELPDRFRFKSGFVCDHTSPINGIVASPVFVVIEGDPDPYGRDFYGKDQHHSAGVAPHLQYYASQSHQCDRLGILKSDRAYGCSHIDPESHRRKGGEGRTTFLERIRYNYDAKEDKHKNKFRNDHQRWTKDCGLVPMDQLIIYGGTKTRARAVCKATVVYIYWGKKRQRRETMWSV